MVYMEQCECGGNARIQRYDKSGVAILKCDRCGDTFDAHESAWKTPNNDKAHTIVLPYKAKYATGWRDIGVAKRKRRMSSGGKQASWG